MADISSLAIAPNEALNFDDYKSVGEGSKFPTKGRYTLMARDSFPADAFKPNAAGTALTAAIDPTIVGPTGEGKVLKFTRISAKTFQRGGKTVSQVGDYLKACGATGQLSGDPQSQADAIEATAGAIFEADLNWRLWAKGAGPGGEPLVIEGMENFPKNDNGEYVPYVISDTLVDDQGQPKRLWANLVIDRFVPRA